MKRSEIREIPAPGFRCRSIQATLLNAAMRAVRSEVAVFALVVDAKDEKASAFYRHHAFTTFGSSPRQLIAPLATFRKFLS
jgi:ribosomal protein S18 acetylase RimI-like enzyme